MNEDFYSEKKRDYFEGVRMDIISLLPRDKNQKILEIGAGAGNTLLYIKEKQLAAEVMGVELMKLPNSNQQHPLIDRFQIANIEREKINAEQEYFDVIICADLLEHLADPWTVVGMISTFLKPGALLIVSVPNFREIKTLCKIFFRKDFQYDPLGGILDKTHLRFFCKNNIRRLVTTNLLFPVYYTPNFLLKVLPDGKKRRIINLLTLGLFQDLLTVQYIFIAKRKP